MGRDRSEYELSQLYNTFVKCAINKKVMKVSTCVGTFEFIPMSDLTCAVYVKLHEPTHAPTKIRAHWSLWNVLWHVLTDIKPWKRPVK